MLNYFPKYFTSKAITLYFIALIAISVAFSQYSMSALWIVFGMVEVVSFFYFVNILTKRWSLLPEKLFIKRLFTSALFLRLAWVVFSYFFYQAMTGQPFEFEAADAIGYHGNGEWGAINFKKGNFNLPAIFGWLEVSDMGYSTYLSILYVITNNSIIITRLIKAILGAWMCVIIYKIALRNFGDNAARISAIICMLWANFIYYTGLHLKETEMIFLVVVFIERADFLLRANKITLRNLIVPILIGAMLFTFRTVLGVTALFSLLTALMLISSKSIKKRWKRPLIIVWVAVAVTYFMGGRIATEVEEVWANRTDNQSTSMEWRAGRQGGNKFAKHMSAAIFAPAIFAIPVPTMIHLDGQENQQMIHGGNYIKEILAFFLLFAFIVVIKNKKWRDVSILEAFLLGYLIIIAFSAFAQSERFHLPAMPCYIILAGYGISNITDQQKKYFNRYMVVLFVIIVAWNWFKLAGRGLV